MPLAAKKAECWKDTDESYCCFMLTTCSGSPRILRPFFRGEGPEQGDINFRSAHESKAFNRSVPGCLYRFSQGTTSPTFHGYGSNWKGLRSTCNPGVDPGHVTVRCYAGKRNKLPRRAGYARHGPHLFHLVRKLD